MGCMLVYKARESLFEPSSAITKAPQCASAYTARLSLLILLCLVHFSQFFNEFNPDPI